MKRLLVVGGVALVFAAGVFSNQLFSQNAKESAGKDDMAKIMETAMKYGTPGEAHKHLKAMEGSWNVENKFWMAEGAEPQFLNITSKRTWVLDGRFLQEDVAGEMQGEAFKGLGIWGYDNFKQQYITYWFDNSGTGCMQTIGSSMDGKAFNFDGKYPNPFNGFKEEAFKVTVQVLNNDKHIYTMYMAGPGGKLFKHMELTYSRKK